MRTLVALTVLMLALAGAVWWKTTGGGGEPENPPTTTADADEGILTVGATGGGRAAEAAGRGAGHTEDATLTGGGAPSPPAPAPEVDPEAGKPAPPPVEPKPEPPPAASGPLRHVVQPGETLYRIVLNAYGTAPQELVRKVAEANGLRDAAAIDKGQTLTLPVLAGYPEPSAG